MCEFPHELPNNLRILGNCEISKKSLKSLELMASLQPATQKPNLDRLARKLQKICWEIFQRNTYFTYLLAICLKYFDHNCTCKVSVAINYLVSTWVLSQTYKISTIWLSEKSAILAVSYSYCMRSVRIRSFPYFGIFLHLDWIRRNTPYLSVFNPNAGKWGPEKLRIWTLFTQCL